MTKIEVGKTYQTRDGRSVRIIATDRKLEKKGDKSIVGLMECPATGAEEVHLWCESGLYFTGSPTNYDLIIPTERKSYWVNLYPSENYGHVRREDADRIAAGHRTHVLEIKTEDGEPVAVEIHEVAK